MVFILVVTQFFQAPDWQIYSEIFSTLGTCLFGVLESWVIAILRIKMLVVT